MPETVTGIAYDHAGPSASPIPIVFLHAGIADRRMWDPQWQRLQHVAWVTRLDLRGFGDSTTRPPTASFTHAQDVIDTMDGLELERVHLVGASFGSGVAADVAVIVPERVTSLLVCPPGGSLLATATETLRDFFRAENEALTAGDLEAAVEANIQAWLIGRDRTVDDLPATVVDQVRRMQRRAFRAAEQLGDVEEIELDPPVLDRLSDVVAPTLVLLGSLDMDTVFDSAERLIAGIPNAGLVEWQGVAHLPSLERPDQFTDLLLDWVGRHWR